MRTSFVRLAVTAATIASLGTPVAFAAQKNQTSRVRARSNTTVSSFQGSFAGSFSAIDQDGGKNSNQTARSNSNTSSFVFGNINATSGNFVVVDQD